MPITMSLNNSDNRLIAIIQAKKRKLLDAVMQKMFSMMEALRMKGKELAPKVTGTLADSIQEPVVEIDGTDIVGTIEWGGDPTTVGSASGKAYDYARIVQEGSTAHRVDVIPPRKALYFLLEGKEVFSKYAQVGGVTPNPFMADALYDMRSEMISGLNETIFEVMGE